MKFVILFAVGLLAPLGAFLFASFVVPCRTLLERTARPALGAGAFLAVLGLPATAIAGTPGATTSADLSQVWLVIISVATPVLAFFASTLAKTIGAHLKIKSGSAAQDDLDQALEHGVNLVLDALGSVAAHNEKVKLPAGALSTAAQMVLKLAPAAASYLGVTEQDVVSMITGRIGRLFAQPAAPASIADATAKS